MIGGGDTPTQTLFAVQIANNGPYVFGFVNNNTYYFYVKPIGGNGFLSNSDGLISFDTGSPLTDQFTTFLLGKLGQYGVSNIGVESDNNFAVGQTVPNWENYDLIDF